MSKPWIKQNTRQKQVRKLLRHLIVCEDAKSAADYFKSFEVSRDFVKVVVVGGAGNTDGLVERALTLRNQAESEGTPYAKVWCVFDRDDFPAHNFNRAFLIARPFHDVDVIWSNECFEIWYLLHFVYRDTAIGRQDIYRELSKKNRLGKKYRKGDKSTFTALRARTSTAMRHAKTLFDSYGGNLKPERDNPSTKVQILVGQLIELGSIES